MSGLKSRRRYQTAWEAAHRVTQQVMRQLADAAMVLHINPADPTSPLRQTNAVTKDTFVLAVVGDDEIRINTHTPRGWTKTRAVLVPHSINGYDPDDLLRLLVNEIRAAHTQLAVTPVTDMVITLHTGDSITVRGAGGDTADVARLVREGHPVLVRRGTPPVDVLLHGHEITGVRQVAR